MEGITVVLDRKQLVARMEAGVLRVDRPEGGFERVPLQMLDRVIVEGSPMVSCGVWRTLAQENIPAVILPYRGHGPAIHVSAGYPPSIAKRLTQYKALGEPEKVLMLCRAIVAGKIDGQHKVLSQFKDKSEQVPIAMEKITEYKEKLASADSNESIMGLEGVSAARYFETLSTVLPAKWEFSGRNRRPPKDPINALFSLGYTIAESEIRQVLVGSGFDPAIGFLHKPQEDRGGFALDILEPIRPMVDDFALRLIEHELTTKHFSKQKNGACFLSKSGRSIFYSAWSMWQSGDGPVLSIRRLCKKILSETFEETLQETC